jgi:pimeloyl-ACP methyl ester carboxylesterase
MRQATGVVVVLAMLVGNGGLRALTSAEFRSESAEVNGIRLHYRIGGSGPAVLLLHGFSGAGVWWDSVMDDFAASHTTIVPDLPMHGRSEGRDGPYRYADVAKDLYGLLDHLGIKRTRGVGYSAGGEVLLHMAIDQPQRIEAMSLVAAAHEIPEAGITMMRKFPEVEDCPEAYRDYWLQVHPGGEPQVRSLLKAMRPLADIPGNMVGEDALARIEAPTLLIVGDRDPFVPLEIVLQMLRALPEAELWVVPGQEHLPLWPAWGGSPAAGETFPGVVVDFFQEAAGE